MSPSRGGRGRGGAGAGAGAGSASPLRGSHFLPFVEMAMWSSTTAVKYSAVAGLATLAKVEENKEAMGQVGALECLATIVYDGLELQNEEAGDTWDSTPGLGGALAKAQQRTKADLKLRRLAATTLADLITNAENQKKFVGGEDIGGGIEKTIGLLRATKSAGLQQALMAMLVTLAGSDDYKERLVDLGVLPPVLQVATKGDERSRLHAFNTCCRLSQNGNNQVKWGKQNVLEVLRWMEFEGLEIKFHMITMETLRRLAHKAENAIVIAESPGGTTAISRLLDAEEYDDDVRGLAMRCISQIAETPETRDRLGTGEILGACQVNLGRDFDGRGFTAVRLELAVVHMLAQCPDNLVKLSTSGWLDAMCRHVLECKDKVCRRTAVKTAHLICTKPGNEELVLPFIPKLCHAMCFNSNLEVQVHIAQVLSHMTLTEGCSVYMRDYFQDIMNLLAPWASEKSHKPKRTSRAAEPVSPSKPGSHDPDMLNFLASQIAANMCTDIEFKSRVPNLMSLVQSFMGLTWSKDKKTQENTTRLINTVSDTSDEDKQTLVGMGLVWRLKKMKQSSSVSGATKILAKNTLSTHLEFHTAAITIQCIARGFLYRKMKEKAAAQAAAARERRRAAAAEAY